jgi:hypothetical protein
MFVLHRDWRLAPAPRSAATPNPGSGGGGQATSPIIAIGPIVDQKQRTAAAATTCTKASRQPVESREAHMKHVAPYEISGPKSARPHGGIPSPGARPVLGTESHRAAERPVASRCGCG